jgi:PAS domain S-box-containing protein
MMLAASPSQLVGKLALDVSHPLYHGQVLEQRRMRANNLPTRPLELKFVRLDGTFVDVETTSMVLDFHGRREFQIIARDTTARIQAVAALRESEERFKFVARAVSDVVWDWDLSANTLWWSDGFFSTFGFVAGDIEPSVEAWTERIHPDDRNRVVGSRRSAAASKAENWTSEYRFQRKDGGYSVVLDRGFIVRDATGMGTRMVGGTRDLTEQRKMETQLLRAQRMDSIGTLAGGIAHDLNNVLAPIMMAIELLKQDKANDPRRLRMLDTIYVSCRRGADLVRQVLSFARGVEHQTVAIKLSGLIEELVGIITQTFPRNIRISSKVGEGLWPIMGDPSQLHQVLLNLAVNARDSMAHGGSLAISAENVNVDEQFAATSHDAKPGTYVLLKVSDTGCGIPPEVRERIFEPFSST